MNELIKVNENGPMALKGTLSADMNKNKDKTDSELSLNASKEANIF